MLIPPPPADLSLLPPSADSPLPDDWQLEVERVVGAYSKEPALFGYMLKDEPSAGPVGSLRCCLPGVSGSAHVFRQHCFADKFPAVLDQALRSHCPPRNDPRVSRPEGLSS
jgi:hypothetical protein